MPMYNNYVDQTDNTALDNYQRLLQSHLGQQGMPMWSVNNQFPGQ